MARPAAAVIVLQHIACEPPGAFEAELLAWGAELTRVEVDAGDTLPDWHPFDAIVAMGGPMGAYDDDRFPWLTEEKRWIAQAVQAGRPFWGVCLGCQLLAASLGAWVGPGSAPEVGVLPVHRTPAARDDPVFSHLPAMFPALQWHSDTYALPLGATHLASSPAYSQQAFAYRRAYGLQFHLEVASELAGRWADVPAYADSLSGHNGANALPELLAEIAHHEEEMTALARRMLAAWLLDAVGLGSPVGAAR